MANHITNAGKWVGWQSSTTGFWLDKPLDAEVPLRVRPTATLREILVAAGRDPDAEYDDTPLDFVEQPGWREWRRRRLFRAFGALRDHALVSTHAGDVGHHRLARRWPSRRLEPRAADCD